MWYYQATASTAFSFIQYHFIWAIHDTGTNLIETVQSDLRQVKMGCCASSEMKQPLLQAPVLTAEECSQHTPDVTFQNSFVLGKELGSGAFATVFECTRTDAPGTKLAVKVIAKNKMDESQDLFIRQEIDILRKLNHRNVLRFEDCFEDSSSIFVVTELLEGGELFDQIVQRTCFNEKDARDIVRTLLVAIKYCHDNNVIHRSGLVVV